VLPIDLVAGELASGELVALPERPALAPVEYSAAFIPSSDGALFTEIARFATEESWFTKPVTK
jgi:hypothetical protein